MQKFINATLSACIEIRELIRTNEDESAYLPIKKGAGGDMSIGFDIWAEEIFVKHLKTFGTISSEESGIIGEGEHLIIIDPIDGSDNLKTAFPYYGASVALTLKDETLIGVVCNLATGECFVRDAQEHFTTNLDDISQHSCIVKNMHAKVGLFEKAGLHPGAARKLMDIGLKFRAPGAVALSLAYAHYVNYVVFLGTMRPYDVAAGLYLCKDLHCYTGDDVLIISKDKVLFEQLLDIFELPKDIL